MSEEEWLKQLAEKDQLIQQLAQELIQVNQHNRILQQQSEIPRVEAAFEGRREQMQWLEKQVGELRGEIAQKEQENLTLLDNLQTVQQENQKLQQYLRDLPELYRQKFTERLTPIKHRLHQIESENKRLQQLVTQELPSGDVRLLPAADRED
jgi:chromosome segregation ATPase